MYADDMALFAESSAALQHMIDALHKYENEWKLTLNVDKTIIVIFRNGGNIKENELEAQGPCAGHRSIIAILHWFSLVHEKYTN